MTDGWPTSASRTNAVPPHPMVVVVLLEPGTELLGVFATVKRALTWCERHLDGEWEQMGEMDEDGVLELWSPLTEQTVTLLRDNVQ